MNMVFLLLCLIFCLTLLVRFGFPRNHYQVFSLMSFLQLALYFFLEKFSTLGFASYVDVDRLRQAFFLGAHGCLFIVVLMGIYAHRAFKTPIRISYKILLICWLAGYYLGEKELYQYLLWSFLIMLFLVLLSNKRSYRVSYRSFLYFITFYLLYYFSSQELSLVFFFFTLTFWYKICEHFLVKKLLEPRLVT